VAEEMNGQETARGNNDRRDAKDIPSKGSARVSVVVVIIHFLPCDKPSRPARVRQKRSVSRTSCN